MIILSESSYQVSVAKILWISYNRHTLRSIPQCSESSPKLQNLWTYTDINMDTDMNINVDTDMGTVIKHGHQHGHGHEEGHGREHRAKENKPFTFLHGNGGPLKLHTENWPF